MKKRTLAALLALMLTLAVLPTSSFALTVPRASKPLVVKDGPVEINAANFPDEIFRGFVSEEFDIDSDGILSEAEIAEVDTIDVTSMGIADLSGVEYFTALQYLFCDDNAITELDISNNSELVGFRCIDNQLTELDISNNLALEWVLGSGNAITELDISNNPALKQVEFDDNQLTELDTSNNPVIEQVTCSGNAIIELDISNNPALYRFECDGNQITNLDIGNNPELTYFSCVGNLLTELNISNAPAIKLLSCYDNQLTELDIINNPAINMLYCNDNLLTELDVSNNPALRELNCSGNKLTSIDVHHCDYIESLICENNVYAAAFGEDGTFDLSTLPGSFDISKASNWVGGSVQGNILTIDEGVAEVTYIYACGMNKLATFTIRAEESIPGVPGDANDDGTVDTSDALLVMRHALSLITLSNEAAALCDMNGDGEITILDATLIMRAALGF